MTAHEEARATTSLVVRVASLVVHVSLLSRILAAARMADDGAPGRQAQELRAEREARRVSTSRPRRRRSQAVATGAAAAD